MPSTDLSGVTSLDQLEEALHDCHRCPLAKTRNKVVFGVGNANADLMFIGEAPGRNEDKEGKPFVGAAGRLLDELLAEVLGLSRQDVYIANVLKCRPPGNRDPEPEEVELCRPVLQKQAQLINPRVICTLGNHATRSILKETVNISRMHGQVIALGSRKLFPVYHPAAALYTRAIRQVLVDDFAKLKQLLRETSATETPQPTAEEQMDLFN